MTTDTDKLVEMAQLFHDTYEALAPAFGYETRPDTKAFDPESPNGKLMCATVAKVRTAVIASLCGDVEPVAFMFQHSETGRVTFVDAWQKENGWAAANPRYSEVGALHGASTVATLKAERDALQEKLWAQDVRCGKLEIEKGALKARVAELEKDAARLEFVCNSPNRMVERESGLWRVYEDVAPTDHPTAVWQGMTPRWHVTPREAIDAAITAALTKGQP